MGIGLYGLPITLGPYGGFGTGDIRDRQRWGQSIGTWIVDTSTGLDFTTGFYWCGKGRGGNEQILTFPRGTTFGTQYVATGIECPRHWGEYIGTHYEIKCRGGTTDLGCLTVPHT